MNSRLPLLTPSVILLAAVAVVALRHRNGAAYGPAELANSKSAIAASGAPAAVEAPDQRRISSSAGDKLLLQAATILERRASVSARLRHQVFIAGKQLYGVGSYWQQGSGADLRVRWQLQIAGHDSSLKQISNSRFLWVDRNLPTGRSVSRIDLRQLRADPVLGASSLDELEPGNATWSSTQPELTAHSGGLPGLLASLSENFSFLAPQAMRLAPQSAESASVPVFAVVGHWKRDRLLALLEGDQESGVESREPNPANAELSTLSSLPNRLPQEVLILVGQADLFPYRIEYRRLETPLATAAEAPPIPYQLSANPLVVLELSDVAFDVPIAAGQFDYAPGDADWIDQTAVVLERLRREREQQLAVRVQNDQRKIPAR